MEVKTNGRTVLWWEIAAFSLLIAVSWADELFGVPALLFGGSHQANYREAGSKRSSFFWSRSPL